MVSHTAISAAGAGLAGGMGQSQGVRWAGGHLQMSLPEDSVLKQGKDCKKHLQLLVFRLLLCLLSSNIQTNKASGRNVCGNSKCCRMFTEGKFQGSGCIVNPGLMALLTHAGQRHHIPTGVSEFSHFPEAITPRSGLCPSFSLSINRDYPSNPFRKYILQKIMVGSGWCTEGARGAAPGRAVERHQHPRSRWSLALKS